MEIKIKNIDRTFLDKDSFLRLIRKYSKLTKDLDLSFDARLTSVLGNYRYDDDKKRHIIKLSLINCKYSNKAELSKAGEKYNFISTLLHELKHAQQKEEMRQNFWKDKNCKNAEIQEESLSTEYSTVEIQARIHENKNILEAVEYYNECLKKRKIKC